MSGYRRAYDDESDADDEYERSMKSPAVDGAYFNASYEPDDHYSAENTPTTLNRDAFSHAPASLVTNWTSDQCADFVANLGFEDYADAFIEEEINGEALIELLHEELKDLGIVSVGHRLTLLKAIYEIKVKHNIPIMHDHYVPLSANANAPDSHATQEDIRRIIRQIRLRDARLLTSEEDIRSLREHLDRVLDDAKRLREDVLPVIRMAKDQNHPLPTPEGLEGFQSSRTANRDSLPSPSSVNQPDVKAAGLSRKFSNKKLFTGSSGKMPSPTIHDASVLDPSAAAKAASSQLTASMSSSSRHSPRSPSSPPYHQHSMYKNAPSSRFASATEDWTHSNTSTLAASRRNSPSTTTTNTASKAAPTSNLAEDWKNEGRDARRQREQERDRNPDAAPNAIDFMKSFRVSLDEPCEKVLPIALKKYKIYDDWRLYSLYIVYGDEERSLRLDEKPLSLFKELASAGKKPMFMLRKHAQEDYDGVAGPSGSSNPNTGGNAGRASYASSALVNLPGGVL